MRIDEMPESNGGKPASQAYWNALRKLRDAWREVFHEELHADGSRAKETYENALETLKLKLSIDREGGKRFFEILDVNDNEDINEALLCWADLDNLTPNQIKTAILEECRNRGQGRHELSAILCSVFNALFDPATVRLPRVGANRHWPRLLQYLRELEEATDCSPDGRGIRLGNIGGRGPVAREPRNPASLSAIIELDYI